MSLDDKAKEDILKSISISGVASDENKTVQIVLASRNNLNTILDSSSGLARIRTNAANKFKLLISQPLVLTGFNPFELRCVLCKKVITYPAWYLCLRYAVNEFHYFVCFDSNSPDKVTAHCYRR